MREALMAVPVSFVVLLVVFRLLELTRPREKRVPILRAGFATDAAYWVFTALATRHATRIVVIVALVPLALLIYGRVDKTLIEGGYGPVSRLPLWRPFRWHENGTEPNPNACECLQKRKTPRSWTLGWPS